MKICDLRKARPDELQTLLYLDNEASKLYAEVGLVFEFENDHPYVLAESARWADAIDQGFAYVATNEKDYPIGFMTLCFVDNEPYLDQISVHPENMRQGVGARLLELAISWSNNRPLWLTTYSHIVWNKPYYERHGFVPMSENFCGPQLCEVLQKQRLALPAPEQRIAMVHRVY